MKKFLFFVVVALVIVLLAAPWFFGGFTEHRIEERLAAGAETNPGVTLVTDEYRRHWFSADSRHRLVITDPDVVATLRQLGGGQTPGDRPAVVVETRILHGPVPLGSLGEEGGSLTPRLSRARSTFSLDLDDGSEPIPLPGDLTTEMAIDGSTRAEYRLDPGSRDLDDGLRLSWEGARIDADISSDGRTVTASGSVRPVRVESVAAGTGGSAAIERLRFDGLQFDSEQRYTEWGIPVGTMNLTTGSAMIADRTAGRISVERMSLRSDSRLEGELLAGSTRLEIDGVEAPAGRMNALLDLAVEDLHAPSLGRLSDTVRQLERQGAMPNTGDVYPLLEADLARLVAEGPTLDVRDLVLELPAGDLRLRTFLALAAGGDQPPPLRPAELIERLTATLQFDIAATLVETFAAVQPDAAAQLQMGIAMGLLREDGERYRVEAEYGNGLLTINGLPLPIPQGL